MHDETSQLHVEPLADVIADFDKVGAALTAPTGIEFLAGLDARLFRWHHPPAGALALPFCQRLGVELFRDRDQVHIDFLSHSMGCTPTRGEFT